VSAREEFAVRCVDLGLSSLATVLVTGLLAGCSGGETTSAGTREVRVAAAADLKFAFDEIARNFAKQNPGVTVKVTYGSSGNLFAQLSSQAPFDLYLSADVEYPRKLIALGKAVKASEFLYAVGHLVLWVPNGSRLDLDKLGIKAVVDPAVKKLAIANPRHAPYGRAAEAALKKLGVYEQVTDHLVLGDNIAQTAQFVESGSADAGILALSLVMAPAMRAKGRYWMIPLDAYPRLEQGGVIFRWAQEMEAAQALRDFVTGKAGRAILEQYGFMLPGE
jgi:molybdate transport system substrate-binding protein